MLSSSVFPFPMSVNFLSTDHDAAARRKTFALAGVFTLFVALVAFAGAAASYQSVQRGTNVLTEFGRLPVISDVGRMVFGASVIPNDSLAGIDTEPDLLRILVLGIGGAGHDGSLLTDTIIMITVDQKTNKVGMVSIPRDMAFPRGDGTFEKINATHAWQEQDHPGEGAIRTAKIFSDFFGTPIDHVVRIDFRGFASLIDAIGGVDIEVDRGFTDTQYPTADELWQTVSFKKGQQHMNGETALIYVRSRHGNNGEGSDFARSARQQKVLMAVRAKLLSLNTLADPGKLAKLYQAITSHLQSDLTPWDAIRMAPLVQNFSGDNVENHVLTDAPDNELVAANVNGSFLLFPRGNDWTRIKSLMKNPFSTQEERDQMAPKLSKVEVKNGTLHTGLAFQTSNTLNLAGFEASNMGNAGRRNYQRTLLVDLTDGKKSDELAKLRRQLNADVSLSSVTSTHTPDGKVRRAVYGEAASLEAVINDDTDFLVILGENSYQPSVDAYVTSSQSQ